MKHELLKFLWCCFAHLASSFFFISTVYLVSHLYLQTLTASYFYYAPTTNSPFYMYNPTYCCQPACLILALCLIINQNFICQKGTLTSNALTLLPPTFTTWACIGDIEPDFLVYRPHGRGCKCSICMQHKVISEGKNTRNMFLIKKKKKSP